MQTKIVRTINQIDMLDERKISSHSTYIQWLVLYFFFLKREKEGDRKLRRYYMVHSEKTLVSSPSPPMLTLFPRQTHSLHLQTTQQDQRTFPGQTFLHNKAEWYHKFIHDLRCFSRRWWWRIIKCVGENKMDNIQKQGRNMAENYWNV